MRNLLIGIALLASVGTSAQTPTRPAPDQGAPPRNLSQRADGHFSANPDPANPERFEVHVVRPGDTLSQIAEDVLKNSRLWPQLWEQNEHIINPHWIYPNDRILIRPITSLTEARPPQPAPPGPEPGPAADETRIALDEPAASGNLFVHPQQKPVSEVKIDDLYCSGFVQKAPLPKDLKVISTYASTGVLASDGEYMYISQGSEAGIVVGSTYQVIRPTIKMTNPRARTRAERELGMHYLEIAQIRVVLAQADFSLARALHSCGDAIEVGDLMMPFQPIVLPPLARPRPFSPFMTTRGEVKGAVVTAKSVLLNFGSAFKMSGAIPGVRGSRLSDIEGGIASEGMIVYLDIGQEHGVRPGDVFIAFREVKLDRRLYRLPKESEKLDETRTAVGELIVVKVGERAATALVTYASDALSQGDAVERR